MGRTCNHSTQKAGEGRLFMFQASLMDTVSFLLARALQQALFKKAE